MKMTLILFVVLLFFTGQVVSKEEVNQLDENEADEFTNSILNNLDTGDVTGKQGNEMDKFADKFYDKIVNLVADEFTDNNNELKAEEEKDEKILADPKPLGRRRAPVCRRRRSWGRCSVRRRNF